MRGFYIIMWAGHERGKAPLNSCQQHFLSSRTIRCQKTGDAKARFGYSTKAPTQNFYGPENVRLG